MSAVCDGRVAEIVRAAIVRRAAALGVTSSESDDMESLGDRLTDVRPSTPESRSLRCDAWIAGDGRWTVAGEAIADAEGMEFDAWLAAEGAAQPAEVRS